MTCAGLAATLRADESPVAAARPAEEGPASVTASEFAFLSFGLVLGVAGGAGIVEIFRTRPAASRVIRLTVTPNSLPARRSVTLSEDAFVLPGPTPANGGPADGRHVDREPTPPSEPRTFVRSPLPPAGAGDPASGLPLSRIVATRPALGFVDARPSPSSAVADAAARSGGPRTAEPVAIPIHLEPDPQLEALRGLATSVHDAAHAEVVVPRAVETVIEAGPGRAPTLTAVADRPAVVERRSGAPLASLSDHRPDPRTTSAVGRGPASDACAEARRVADERCAVATIAREQADAAQEAVRSAQRAYDEHMTRAEAAAAAGEPGGIRAAKERAQHAFRDARATASSPEELEGAARDWLDEINRINRDARDASAALIGEREAAHGLVTTIERLTVEADAARAAAETAETACTEARETATACEEAAARTPTPPRDLPAAPPLPLAFGEGSGAGMEEESELGAAFAAVGPAEPAVLRLLRGDRATLGRLVEELAGGDPVEQRRWQIALAGLVDAIVARAIEAAYFQFPEDHPFWGTNSQQQNRDVAAALSSLGYRFNGLGGWADDRVPSQRDLSLAVGYAGLDPMRTRRWPGETEMRELFRDVTVAADEYLASAAGELTLGELVAVLGRRADGLADVWNEWGRVRPLLLSGG